jgi:hypothetical protein
MSGEMANHIRKLWIICLLTTVGYSYEEPFWASKTIKVIIPSPPCCAYWTVVTVPAHKVLYLQEVTFSNSYEFTKLAIDSNTIISGLPSYSWPDNYLKLNPGQSLIASICYCPSGVSSFVTVTGYYEAYCPRADLNGDCKVNFADFAIFAQSWLECNIEPPSDCD